MGAVRVQGIEDGLQHCLGFLKHLVVPEAKHAESSRADPAVAMLVVAKAVAVLSAVEFDDEPCFETREVGDVSVDRDLATESMAAELAPAQMSPEVLLSVRRLISQSARAALCDRIAHDSYCRRFLLTPGRPLPSPPPRSSRRGGWVQRRGLSNPPPSSRAGEGAFSVAPSRSSCRGARSAGVARPPQRDSVRAAAGYTSYCLPA